MSKAASVPPATIVPNPDNMSQPSSPVIAGSTDLTTTNLQSIPTSRLGMERGYSLSPMYSLILEYNTEQGNNLSTTAEVSWILQKPCLKPQDIEMREDNSDPHTAVRMINSKMQPILRVVTELQTFLERMAQLIPERNSVFRIDPHETMTSALQGCTSRSQLEVAYKILLKRLLVAQQTVIKYESQYRQMEAPLSPISTALDLYEEFDNIDSVDNRMRYMLNNIPHHQTQVLPATREALRNRLGWDIACPTLPLPLSSSQLLPPGLSQTANAQGKKKVDWDDTAPWEGTSTSIEQGRNLEQGVEPSFGFQMPFKKGTRFFDTSTDEISSAYFSTPSPASTPDVTLGLATPSRTNLANNIREYNASQGTKTLAIARPTSSSFTQTAMAMMTSNSAVRNNATPQQVSPNRAGGNNPPGDNGNDPSHPGGGGGGPSLPGGGGRGGGMVLPLGHHSLIAAPSQVNIPF